VALPSKRIVVLVTGWLCLLVTMLLLLVALSVQTDGCIPTAPYLYFTPYDCEARLERFLAARFGLAFFLVMSVSFLLGSWWDRRSSVSTPRNP